MELRVVRFLCLSVLVMAALWGWNGYAAAAPGMSAVSGTVVGDAGGAVVEWAVDLPPTTNVTLALGHYPCNTDRAVYIEVYGPEGKLATSQEDDACTENAAFNTVGGGPGTIKLFNYIEGVAVSYTLTADGIVLPAGEEAGPVSPDSGDQEAATTEIPSDGSDATDTLLGNSGGAKILYPRTDVVAEPQEVRLTYTMSGGGGSWPGVGINVWAEDGALLATSEASGANEHTLQFTPTSMMNLTIEVFNYNPGQTMEFVIQGLPGGQELVGGTSQ